MSTSWRDYFDSRCTVSIPSRKISFNVYQAGSTGPVVFCIHGGGYTGLTWALMAAQLKSACRIVAPDVRGHGETNSDDDLNLSMETLATDMAELWKTMFVYDDKESNVNNRTMFVGHSMGGAVGVHAAHLLLRDSQDGAGHGHLIEGIAVIDVVEGTALSSLPFMQSVLKRRPASFSHTRAAVEWAIETGFSRNKTAAALSVASMLIERTNTNTGGASGTTGDDQIDGDDSNDIHGDVFDTDLGVTLEEEQEQEEVHCTATHLSSIQKPPMNSNNTNNSSGRNDKKTARGQRGAWVWRTPLELSSPYWRGWYNKLSTLYLDLKIPKMLILAGTDRLDRELTIGQMQGKFQLVLLSRAGHAVHEDEPDQVASALAEFISRFKIGQENKVVLISNNSNNSLFRVV